MKINSNIPKGIREGIFGLMTGTFVFLANGVTADAADLPGQNDGENTGVSNEYEIGENIQNAALTVQEAAELISVPEEPGNSQMTETIDENTSVATITTENTYVEVTDNAIATTDETVVETIVTNPETLTKDIDNATSTTQTTQTVNNDGTITTTQTTTTTGNYVEDVTTVETNSVTNITTSDENLVNAIASQVETESHNNTDSQGINVEQITVDTYIDNARPGQDPIALDGQQAAELAGVSDGTLITVETTNGESTVTIEDQEVALSDGLTDIIVNSAKENVVQHTSTFSINGQEISGEELGSLELDMLGAKTDFTIINNEGAVTITYLDANGATRMVTDPELKNKLIGFAETIASGTVVEDYKGLTEYENTNDPELLAEKERLESIGYENIRLVDGTGTYVNGTIEPETYNTQTEAENRANELNNDGKHANAKVEKSDETYVSGTITPETYNTQAEAENRANELNNDGKHANAKAEKSGETYVSGTITPETYDTKTEAENRANDLNKDGKHANAKADKSDETYKKEGVVSKNNLTASQAADEELKLKKDPEINYINIKTTTDAVSSEAEAESIKSKLIESGFIKDDINIIISGDVENKTYTVVAQQTLHSEQAKNDRLTELNALIGMGYSVTWAQGDTTTSPEKIFYNATDWNNEITLLENNDYTVPASCKNAGSKAEAERIQALLYENGFGVGEVAISEQSDHSYKITVNATYSDKTKATKNLAYLVANGFTNQAEPVTNTNTTSTEVVAISQYDGFSVTTESEYKRIKSLRQVKNENGEIVYYHDQATNKDYVQYFDQEKNTYYILEENPEGYEIFTVIASDGNVIQHQEGAYITGGTQAPEGNHPESNNNTEHDAEYGISIADFLTEYSNILQKDATSKDWHRGEQQPIDKYLLEIDLPGTYYIDGSHGLVNSDSSTFIHIKTTEKVNIILYNDHGDTVYVPIVTTRDNYQPNQTGNNGRDDAEYRNSTPNVTFVTKAKYVQLANSNTVGNILAPESTVSSFKYPSWDKNGNFAGTIVCQKANGIGAEGHTYKYGYKGYLVDSRKVQTGSETTYSISGSKEVYTVSGELQNYNITVSKDATRKAVTADELSNKYVVTADELANKYVVTADEVDHKYTVTADTLANKVVLAAKRTVESQTSKATLEKTDYTRTATSLERVFGIQISRYSLASTSDPWIETTVVQIPSQTPPPTLPDIPVTPPETPDVPPTTPDVPPTTPPTIIIDEPTPLASEVAQVLGARRGPAVLGARRGRTDDMAHNPLVSSLIMMGASAAALSLLASLKKRK